MTASRSTGTRASERAARIAGPRRTRGAARATAVLATTGARLGRVLAWIRGLRLDRLLLTGATLAGIVMVLVQTPILVGHGVLLAPAFALTAVQCAAIPAALRRPVPATVAAIGAALVLAALTVGAASAWPWSPVLIVTQSLVFAAAATRARLLAALLLWLLGVSASALLAAVLRPDDGAQSSTDLGVFGAVAAVVVVLVLLLTQWQRVRALLTHERRLVAEQAAARQVAEERTRIARELHDVVAHSLSIITVQASTARFRNTGVDADSAAEFDRIAAQSREALDEMRGLLRVLRGTEGDAPRYPQPGLADIAGLVDQVAATGTPVTLTGPTAGWDAAVTPLTALTAFRIVQEATSNALRHAPGAPIEVRLGRLGDRLDIAVTNGPPPRVAPAGPPGHGLVGMRERAASAGGSIRIGPDPDGGFAVRATLPAAGLAS